jgi:iron complex outermembrane recepter protein
MKKNLTFRRSLLSRSVLAACGASALAFAMPPVMAQTAPTLQRVEVTGSNIPRADKETPSPVQVITSEELKSSGYTTVNEVLQNLTSNGQGTLGKGFSGAFASGASGVSLRGLSLGATLILIDGHRMAPYPLADDAQRSFVDISSIPFSAVERIEVLKDGASAVYGSDAMAGVINVILKKQIEGTNVSAELGTTTQGGGATRNFSISHGFGNADDKYSGYVGLEARHGDAVKLNQRSGDWTKFDWRDEGGLDLRPGARNPLGARPRISRPILQIPGSASGTASNFIFLPGCNHADWRASNCTYENTWAQLQPETDNLNLIGRLNAKITNDWDLRLTGSRFESKTKIANTQAAIPDGTFAGVTAIGLGQAPAVLGANPSFRVPITYPGNTFGVAANVRGFLPDFDTRRIDVKTVATRLAAEATGSLAGWDLNAAVGYTKVETTQTFKGYINFANLYSALNDVANPFLIAGGNSQAMLDRVSPTVNNLTTSELTFIDGRGSRELTQLPGGPLAMALGYSYAYKKSNAPNAFETSSGAMALPGAYAAGNETSNSAYLEFVAPVAKNLELDAALRFDKFDTYGNSVTPKLAFKFAPSKEVTLRGTASWGFRAPGPSENGDAGSLFGFNAIRDPLLCAVSDAAGDPDLTAAANVPAFCTFNPTYLQSTTKALEPEKSKSITLGLILEPIKGWSTTLDYYKVIVDGQIVSEASTPGYDPLQHIVRSTPQNVTFGDGSTGLSSVGPIQYATTGYVNAQQTSTSGIEFETKYKFNLENKGAVTVGVQFSRMFDYIQTINGVAYNLAGTHGPTIVGGNTANPQNRAQFTLAYERGPWNVTSTTNYVGSYDLTDPSLDVLTCDAGVKAYNSQFPAAAAPPDKYCTVGAFSTTNLAVKYQYNKGLTLRGSIVNLFNTAPPVDLNTYGGTGANGSSSGSGAPYNPSLHQAGAIGRVISIGLDYKF